MIPRKRVWNLPTRTQGGSEGDNSERTIWMVPVGKTRCCLDGKLMPKVRMLCQVASSQGNALLALSGLKAYRG